MSESAVECSVCKAQRHEFVARKSKLMPQTNLFLCSECADKGREPRWLIILVGRSRGPLYVSKWLQDDKYFGRPILATELVK